MHGFIGGMYDAREVCEAMCEQRLHDVRFDEAVGVGDQYLFFIIGHAFFF